MTVKELYKLRGLRDKIRDLEERIEVIRSKAEKMTSVITGLPGGGEKADYKIKLLELCADYESAGKESIFEEQRLLKYIESINDIQLQNIIRLRFIDSLTWNEVADKIGGNNTDYTVKKRLYRHLRRENGRD